MRGWFNDNTFWKNLEPFLFHHIRSMRGTSEEIKAITSLMKLKREASVLDLCCGPGRVTLPLARRGFRLTGVDQNKYYLDKAKSHAKMEGLKVEWVREDMRGFLRPDAFNAAINLFSSFGYFDDPHHDIRVLENVYASLKPGGFFLIDLMGRETLKKNFREKTWHHDKATGAYLLEEGQITRRWDWVENHWTWIRGKTQKEYKFGIRIYSGEELRAALTQAGFDDVTLYGSFQGTPYDNTATRLIARAKK